MYASKIDSRSGAFSLPDYPEGALTGQYQFIPHDILIVRNLMPFAKELIETANRVNNWVASPTARGNSSQQYDPGGRNNTRCDIRKSAHPEYERFENLLISVCRAALQLYMMDNTFIAISRDESFQLLRYGVDQHFKPHIDTIMGRPTAEGTRAISMVAYLNDDYQGGELNFPRQEITIKPEAGSIILFPSFFTHIHESQSIKEGTKYSVVTWFS